MAPAWPHFKCGSLPMTQWGPWWAAGSGSESAETLQGPSGAISSQSISLDSGTNVICWFLRLPHISVTGRAWGDPACSMDVETRTVGGVLGPHGQATAEEPPTCGLGPSLPLSHPSPQQGLLPLEGARAQAWLFALQPRSGSGSETPGVDANKAAPDTSSLYRQVGAACWNPRLSRSERNKSRRGAGKATVSFLL